MIPKIIHYCWLSGDDYPEKIAYCISSWKKHLPDYEFWLWDLNRFDIDSCVWCKQAFSVKKYAFAADYIRFYALYHHGGIYLDSDVEVIKSFDTFLDLPYFIGTEFAGCVEPAIMGAEAGWSIAKEMIDYYNSHSFMNPDGSLNMTVCPDVLDGIVQKHMSRNVISSKSEFQNDPAIFNVFEPTVFSPKESGNPKIVTTENTYSIHHFEASWYPVSKKMYRWSRRVFGAKFTGFLSRIYKRFFFKHK